MPVEQQVVVVQGRGAFLAVGVGVEEPLQLLGPLAAPGKVAGQDLRELLPRIDAAAVDRHAGALLGKAAIVAGQAQLGADHVQKVFGIGPVVDRELRIQADGLAVLAQQPGGDGVEGAAPDAVAPRAGLAGRQAGPAELAEDAVHPADHLGGRAAGEGEQQDLRRVHPLGDQRRDPIDQGRRLAGPRAGHDQQRPPSLLDRVPLLRIEPAEKLGDGRAGGCRWLRQNGGLPAGTSARLDESRAPRGGRQDRLAAVVDLKDQRGHAGVVMTAAGDRCPSRRGSSSFRSHGRRWPGCGSGKAASGRSNRPKACRRRGATAA